MATFGNYNPAQYIHNDQTISRIGDRFANVASNIPALYQQGKKWQDEQDKLAANDTIMRETFDKFQAVDAQLPENERLNVPPPQKGESVEGYTQRIATVIDGAVSRNPQIADKILGLTKHTETIANAQDIHAGNQMLAQQQAQDGDRFANDPAFQPSQGTQGTQLQFSGLSQGGQQQTPQLQSPYALQSDSAAQDSGDTFMNNDPEWQSHDRFAELQQGNAQVSGLGLDMQSNAAQRYATAQPAANAPLYQPQRTEFDEMRSYADDELARVRRQPNVGMKALSAAEGKHAEQMLKVKTLEIEHDRKLQDNERKARLAEEEARRKEDAIIANDIIGSMKTHYILKDGVPQSSVNPADVRANPRGYSVGSPREKMGKGAGGGGSGRVQSDNEFDIFKAFGLANTLDNTQQDNLMTAIRSENEDAIRAAGKIANVSPEILKDMVLMLDIHKSYPHMKMPDVQIATRRLSEVATRDPNADTALVLDERGEPKINISNRAALDAAVSSASRHSNGRGIVQDAVDAALESVMGVDDIVAERNALTNALQDESLEPDVRKRYEDALAEAEKNLRSATSDSNRLWETYIETLDPNSPWHLYLDLVANISNRSFSDKEKRTAAAFKIANKEGLGEMKKTLEQYRNLLKTPKGKALLYHRWKGNRDLLKGWE